MKDSTLYDWRSLVSFRIRLAVSVATFLVVSGNPCFGDEALLRRCLTFWNEYQNMHITGVVKIYDDDKLEKSVPFEYNIGQGKDGRLPPWEILHYVPNPGEPHLDSDRIVDLAWGFDGELGFHFKRDYVTTFPPSARLSSYHILGSSGMGGLAYQIRKSLLLRVDAPVTEFASLDPRMGMKTSSIEILGNERYLNVDVSRVRFTINPIKGSKDVTGKEFRSMHTEALVALAPTLQVLKVISITLGDERVPEERYLKISQSARTVESVKVMGNWLICDRSSYVVVGYIGEKHKRAVVEIEKVEPLSEGYVGVLWDYQKITGSIFGGDAEKGTRRKSNRKTFEHTKELTYVPYTEEEQEKIRQFLLSQAQPVKPKVNWLTVSLWAANALGAIALGWFVYRYFFSSRAR